MALRITLDLTDKDLKLLRKEMKKSQAGAEKKTELQVIEAADEVLQKARKLAVPQFVAERLDTLQQLIGMLTDRQWLLPDKERERVAVALGYFENPKDIIPDDIPGIGLLDDAIMIELIKRDLQHEIDAYADFCKFRQEGGKTVKPAGPAMEKRRAQLHERMRRRRRGGRSGGSSGGPVGFF